MKKVLFVLVLVLAILPVSSVLAAAEEDVARGLPVNRSGSATYALTDGDDSTGITINGGGGASLSFPNPVDIKRLRIVNNAQAGKMRVTVYGADGTKEIYNGTAGQTDFPVDSKNVRQIAITAISYNLNIYTISAYAPVPYNTDESLFIIKNLKNTPVSDTVITLSWDPIQSVYFRKFNVYQDGTFVKFVTNSTVSFSGLATGKTYTFKITPVDTFDKEFDGASTSYTVPVPDTTPPDQVQGVKVQPSNTSAVVTWNKSSADDLAGYTVYLDGRKASTSLLTTESYKLSGLTPKTDYRVYVVAQDKTGNVSVKSDDVSFTTTNPTTDSDQEATPDYLLVTWTETAGASGYNIYLNGRKVGSTGPDERSFKITKAMGYNPANLVNKTEVRATFPDGSEGSGGGGSGGGLDGGHYLDFIGVMPMIETAIAFLGIYKLWIILVLAVIFSPVLYGLIVKLVNYVARRNAVEAPRKRSV